MLEVLAKFICFLLMSVLGFYVIKQITHKDIKLLSKKTLSLLLIMTVVPIFLYNIKYSGAYTVFVFCVNIIVYKNIFEVSAEESVIFTGILMFMLFISEIIISLIFINFYEIEVIRSNWGLTLIINVCICLFNVLLINIPIVRKTLTKFYKNISKNKSLSNIILFVLLILGLSIIMYNITTNYKINIDFIANIIVMIVLIVITYIYIRSRNNYSELSKNYDNLFNYVQNFEDWIEKEQLNRHEYKNQLAVLRDITKEKKTKNKIDEILEDNINIDGDIVNQLKTLPKGGIKGLMYYKLVIAQKNKIDLTVDVSIKKRSKLYKLSEKQVKDLCKLIGIYFDNAIEAATKTKKRRVLIEIYELKDKINVVFSNTFRKSKTIKSRYEKGATTKGKGRGNGLYFANKIISKNKWIEEKHEIIDKYYIQKISILKLEK